MQGNFNNGMRPMNNPPLSDGDKTNQRKENDQHNKNEVNKMINNQNQKPQVPPAQKQKPVAKKLEQGKDKKKDNGNKTPTTKKKEIQYVRIFAIQQHYKQSDF